MRLFTTVLVSLLVVFISATAQPIGVEYSSWHFGVSAIYPFGFPYRGILTALEGCAVYRTPLLNTSDSTYWTIITDGVSVYDQHGTLAFNSGLMGHPSSTQSALVVPHPGNASQFFIFTAGAGPYVNDNNIGIRYSKVTPYLNLQWIVSDRNTMLLDTATEKLVGVGHCNDHDYWVIAHGWGDNRFYAWAVGDTGVTMQPVISSVGAVHSRLTPEYTIGYMKASPDGRKLAVVCNNMRSVQLFDFDNSTGIVSNPVSLPSVSSIYSGEYGASFSSDNTKLYISGIDSTLRATLYQYTVTGTPAQIVASRQLIFSAPIVGNPTNQIAALQLTQGGKILCARAESAFLGVINSPNSTGTACNYVHSGIQLPAGESSFGLPNNIDKVYNTGSSCYRPRAFISQDPRNICVGQCINFYDSSRHRPTMWKWLFPGAQTPVSTDQNPQNICYNTEGTYDITLIVGNDKGADTVVFHGAVIVWPNAEADAGSDVSICTGTSTILQGSGGRSYLWTPDYKLSDRTSSNPIAAPLQTTTYILRTSIGPCIDYDTVVVTVLKKPEILNANYTVCRGDTIRHVYPPTGTYHWSPATGLSDTNARNPLISVQQTTQYQVTITDTNGCVAVASVNVVVSTPPEVDAGKDVSICPGTKVKLRAQGNGDVGQYSWRPSEGLDDPGSPTPIASPTVTTFYRVTYIDSKGCTDIDTVKVTVLSVPQVSAGPDTGACAGSPITLRAVGPPGSYSWTPVAGVVKPNEQITEAMPTGTTLYRVTFTDENGCTSSDSVLVTMRKTSVSAGADVSVCKGETVRLRAVGASDIAYSWTPKEGLDNPTSKTPLASPKQTTVYTVTVTDKFGCTAVDSVVVSISTTGTVDAGEDRTVCTGGVVQLNASGLTGTYLWAPAEGLDNPTSDSPVASPSRTMVYTLFVKSPGGCEARDTVVLTVLPLPDVNAGRDISICKDGSVQLLATGGEGRYFWQPSKSLDNPASASPVASPDETTMYWVTLIDENGCTATDTLTVFVADTLTVDAGPNVAICEGDTAHLAVSAAEGIVLWTPADGLDDPHSMTPKASPAATTTYRVTITDPSGCSGSDVVTVEVSPRAAIDASGDTSLCSGTSARLVVAGSDGSVLWTPAAGLDNPTSRTPVASPKKTTLYIVVLTTSGGCTATDSVRVVVGDAPVVVAEGDTTVCAGEPIVLRARAGNGTYRWEPDADVENPTSPITTAHPITSTVYKVHYSDGSGCTATDSVVVAMNETTTVDIILPDTAVGVGTANLELPIVVRSQNAIAGPVSLAFTVRYIERVLKFTNISRGTFSDVRDGEYRVLTIRIDDVLIASGEAVVAHLTATALLSSVQQTELTVGVDTTAPGSCLALRGVDGSVAVEGVCVDRDLRFFSRTRVVAGPNPAADIVNVHVISPGNAVPSMHIRTLWGTSVSVSMRQELAADGDRTFVCDISQLAAGTYSVVVQLAGEQYVYPLCVVK